MSRVGQQHPAEAAIEWLAPVPLALAVAWASGRLGLAPVESIAFGVAALIVGFAAFKLGGAHPVPLLEFQPAEFESVEPDELILEAEDSVLELNDRLELPSLDSRVIRLFERQDPTPGELVDRIVDFLAEGRRQTVSDRPTADGRRPPDASAALHDALVNIRASLR